MDADEIKLRPHHAMCIRFFRGEGYSGEFIRGMADVIGALESDPVILLTAGADLICSRCPGLSNGVCASERKVRGYDEAVLRLCGLDAGMRMKYSKLRKLVDERIIAAGARRRVCGDCEWDGLCNNAEVTE